MMNTKSISLVSQLADALNYSIDNHDCQLKNGIVLFGPKGSGKTTLAIQLIGSYNMKRQSPAIYVAQDSTLIVDGIILQSNKVENQQVEKLKFDQKLVLNHMIKLFEANLQTVLVLNNEKMQKNYLFEALNNFLKFWNFQESNKNQDMQAILNNFTIVLSHHNGQTNRLIYMLELLKHSSKCDEDMILLITNLLSIYTKQRQDDPEWKQSNRIIQFKKQIPNAGKSKGSDLLKKIKENKKSQLKMPLARISVTKATQKICIQYLQQGVSNFYKTIQIVKSIFDLATKQQNLLKPQQTEKFIVNKLMQIDDIQNKFQINQVNFLKQEGYVTFFRKIKFQDFRSFATMKNFIISIALVLQHQERNRFYKILEVIMDCSLSILAQSEAILNPQIIAKYRQKLVKECTLLLKHIDQVIDIGLQSNQDFSTSEDTYSHREIHNHWFKCLNEQRISQELIKAREMMKQLSQFDQFIDEIPQNIVNASIDISVLLNRAQANVEAIQYLLVSKCYREAMMIVSQKASTSPQISKKYLLRLYFRLLNENQFQFAQKCLDIIFNKTYSEKDIEKLNRLYQQLYEKKKSLKKAIKNQSTRVLYNLAVQQQSVIQKIRLYLKSLV